MKLTKTTLYFYSLPNRLKRQIGSYVCEVIEDKDNSIKYKDSNGKENFIQKEYLNFTTYRGAENNDCSFIFENVNENENMNEVEIIVNNDAVDLFQALVDFAKKGAYGEPEGKDIL